MQRRRRWNALAASVLTVALLGGTVAAAPAVAAGPNRYDVWSCRGPLGEPVGTSAWIVSETGEVGDVVVSDDCATGGALDLSLASGRAFAPGVRGRASLLSPPGTHIDSWTLWRSLATAAPGGGQDFDYAAAITERGAARADHGCSTAQVAPLDCLSAGSETDPADPANRVDRPGTPVLSSLEAWVGCLGAVCDAPLAGTPARVRLYGSRVEVHDVAPPARPQLSGTLVEAATVSGDATLVVDGSDEGGGIAAMTFSVDGVLHDTSRPAGPRGRCREPYTVVQPCAAVAARAFRLDTTTLAEGPHTIEGTVVDAGGNVTAWGPLDIVVRQPARDDGDGDRRDDGDRRGDGPPPVPPSAPPVPPSAPPPAGARPPAAPPVGNGQPVVTTPRLRLDRRSWSRPGGRRVRVRGTLRTAGGQPIAGARLTVAAQPLGTVKPVLRELAPVTTTAAGRFSLLVGGRGAERVTIAFAPRADAVDTVRATATVREPVSLSVERSRARLRRGASIVLRGKLRGTGAAARNAVVELQAIVDGGWRTVATVRADRRGRYRWRYRFVRITRDTIFSFRAVVRRTPGWPWRELRTRPIDVRVDAVS